jgi:hypothetical protein
VVATINVLRLQKEQLQKKRVTAIEKKKNSCKKQVKKCDCKKPVQKKTPAMTLSDCDKVGVSLMYR